MGKYVYLCFLKLTERGRGKGSDFWSETWMPKLNELCKEHNIDLLAMGAPFGTIEDVVVIYDTDKPLDEFVEFRMKIASLSEERLVAHARTITVLKL